MNLDNNLALELYKLVRAALSRYVIRRDELEDITQDMMLACCQKINVYDSTRSTFSTFIYLVVESEMKHRHIYLNAQKRLEQSSLVYLDEYLYEEERKRLIDTIPSKVNVQETFFKSEIIREINHLICQPLALWCCGVSKSDVGKLFNVSRQNISNTIKRNIDNIKLYCKRKGYLD